MNRFTNQNIREWILKRGLPWLIVFAGLYLFGHLIPEGFDWTHYYKLGLVHPIWTPWSKYIVQFLIPLGYPFVFALSVIGVGVRAFRHRPAPWKLIFVFFNLPLLWVFFMGNLDGLGLFGLLVMPWGIPLVLMKPQIAAFALLARRKWFLAAVIWTVLSFIIWGFWPVNFLMVGTPEWKAEWVQDISLFPWGLLIALPLMWFSRGDEDLLIAAGSLATPHLFPYHFIWLAPSLARMKTKWLLLAWFVSCLCLPMANAFGAWAWHSGNLMSVAYWIGIYFSRPRDWKPSREKAWFKEGTRLGTLERWAFGD